MKNRQTDWSQPQKQAMIGLVLILVKVIRRAINVFLPLILLYVVRSQTSSVDKWQILLIVLSAFMVVRAVLEYFNYRYYIDNNELVIRKGVFRRQLISLPLEKIQGVQLEQHLIHKLFGAARMSFDTPGTESTEVKIDAIEMHQAAALKAFILEHRAEQVQLPAEYEYDEKKIVTLGLSDLLRLSFSANHVEAFFILLGFLFSMFENIRSVLSDKINSWVNNAAGWLPQGSFTAMVALVVFVLLISVVISVARTFITYFNFFISTREKGFRIYGGLINVREKLLPYSKIQFITWRANLIRKWLGIYLLQYYSVGSDNVKDNQQIRVPVTRTDFLPSLTDVYHPEIAEGKEGRRIHRAYVGRKTLISVALPALLVTGVAWYWLEYYALWILLLIPLGFFHHLFFARKFRYYLSEEAMQVRTGIWGIQNVLLRWDKIQKISVKQTLFQEKKGLATILLHTAGGTVLVPFIDKSDAFAIRDYALYKIETSESSWM